MVRSFADNETVLRRDFSSEKLQLVTYRLNRCETREPVDLIWRLVVMLFHLCLIKLSRTVPIDQVNTFELVVHAKVFHQ